MKLLMVGVNHEILNLDDRKDFYFRESDKYAFSTLLLDEMIDQTVILSTCNRSEVYVFVEDDFEDEKLKYIFLQYFHQKDKNLYLKSGENAILYLLEVSCGLKSMVIGEDQILHQIKEAYNWSLQQHFTGKEMNYLFNQLLAFAKKMKREYAISNHPLSLSYIGYQYILNDIQKGDKVMICGSGEIAQLMMEYLKEHEMYIVNRTYDNVKEFLNEFHLDDFVVERVSYLVGHHHTYENVNGIDYQILLEADFLVNADEMNLSKQAILNMKNNVFQTESGKELISVIYDL